MKLSKLKTNPKKVNSGVWCEWEGGTSFLLARTGNDAYNAEVAAFHASNRERKERKEPLVEFSVFWPRLLARTVLLDWSGVDGEDGKPLKYTPAEGEKALADKDLKDLLDFVELESSARRNYKEAADDAAEKNS